MVRVRTSVPDRGDQTQTTSIVVSDGNWIGTDPGEWEVPGVLIAFAGTMNLKRSRLCCSRYRLGGSSSLFIGSRRRRIDADDERHDQ